MSGIALFKIIRRFAIALFAYALTGSTVLAQGNVPRELDELAKMELSAGQQKLQSSGWEFAYSSMIKREQYWWNEANKVCISLKTKDKAIDSVKAIATTECEKRVARTRKVWDAYSEGQSSAKSATLDAERAKLTGQGLKPVYSYKGLPDDISIEYWASAEGKVCKSLIFQNSDNALEGVLNQAPKKCVYPVKARKK